MMKGNFTYNNKLYYFESEEGNILSIQTIKFNKLIYEELKHFENIFKINLDLSLKIDPKKFKVDDAIFYDVNKVYLLGITDNKKLILFNINSAIGFHKKINFEVYYYIIMDKKFIDNKICNLNNSNISIKTRGNDIKNFYTKFRSIEPVDFYSNESLNIPSIFEFDYTYIDKKFKINVDIKEYKDFKYNENYYINGRKYIIGINRYNILDFNFNIKNIEYQDLLALVRKIYWGCCNFFRYIYRKKYIDIDNTLNIEYNVGDKKYNFNFVYIENYFKIEDERNYKYKIVKYDDIQDPIFLRKLFKLCIENKLTLDNLSDAIDSNLNLDYLPDTIDNRHEYTASRLLYSFSVFENVYDVYYNNESKDNNNDLIDEDEKKKVMSKINKFLDGLENEYNNNESIGKFINNIKHNIKHNIKPKISLRDKFNKVLKYNKNILISNGFEEEINNICDSLAKIRDNAAEEEINNICDSLAKIRDNAVKEKINNVLGNLAKMRNNAVKEKINNKLDNLARIKENAVEKEINNICHNLAKIRNNAVHGRILKNKVDFEKWKLLEKMIYIMVLRKLELNEDKIKLFLYKLFEN